MKRKQKNALRFRILCIIFISLCIFSFTGEQSAYSVKAEDISLEISQKEVDHLLQEEIRAQLNELDLQGLEAYLRMLDEENTTSLEERLLAFIKDGAFDYKQFWSDIGQVFFAQVSKLMPAFACIAAISLLSGLLSTLKSSTIGKTSSEMIFLFAYAASLIPLISVLIDCFSSVFQSIDNMSKQMEIIFPIMLTLLSASGGTVSAAICRPAVSFFATTIVSVIQNAVFPFTVLIVAFSMASHLTKELKIGKFTAFFKSINKWIIGICISVFGLFFTLQGITSATYDGAVRRAAKYAIGNGVPIVGGFLSGGFDLAVAGSILIKNSIGSMSIFLMASILLEPLILLACVNLFLRLIAAVSQPFGDSRISDFLEETATNLQYCTAGLLFTAFLYFLCIVMMICCTEALF